MKQFGLAAWSCVHQGHHQSPSVSLAHWSTYLLNSLDPYIECQIECGSSAAPYSEGGPQTSDLITLDDSVLSGAVTSLKHNRKDKLQEAKAAMDIINVPPPGPGVWMRRLKISRSLEWLVYQCICHFLHESKARNVLEALLSRQATLRPSRNNGGANLDGTPCWKNHQFRLVCSDNC